MSRRNESFDAVMSEKMKDLAFAKESLCAAEDYCGDIDEALRLTIERMGISEFADLAHVKIQNVSAFVNRRRNITGDTRNKYLAVFGLKSKLILVEEEAVA